MKPNEYAMFVVPGSISVQLPDSVRTTTFRWTAGAFSLT